MPGPRRVTGVRPIELLVLTLTACVGVGLLGLRVWLRSREEARATQCRSILEGFGQAFAKYTVDSGGWLPYENVGRAGEGHVAWFDALEAYMVGGERICPSVDRRVEHHREGYRLNSQLARSGVQPSEKYRRLDSIQQPEATVILFDAEYGGRKNSMKGKMKDVDYRHNGSANVLFADWHVERYSRAALEEGSNWLPPKVVWNPDIGELGKETTEEEP